MRRFLVLILAALAATTGIATAQTPTAPSGDFLAKNAHAEGVKTLPSGLQYKVIATNAAGASPKAGDIIKVHYEGSLTNGKVFDSSFARGKPALMPLENLVPAWMEAIPLMHVGDEWVIYAPPELGYGAEGAGPIPPNSTLVFRIKLLGMLSPD